MSRETSGGTEPSAGFDRRDDRRGQQNVGAVVGGRRRSFVGLDGGGVRTPAVPASAVVVPETVTFSTAA